MIVVGSTCTLGVNYRDAHGEVDKGAAPPRSSMVTTLLAETEEAALLTGGIQEAGAARWLQATKEMCKTALIRIQLEGQL